MTTTATPAERAASLPPARERSARVAQSLPW